MDSYLKARFNFFLFCNGELKSFNYFGATLFVGASFSRRLFISFSRYAYAC